MPRTKAKSNASEQVTVPVPESSAPKPATEKAVSKKPEDRMPIYGGPAASIVSEAKKPGNKESAKTEAEKVAEEKKEQEVENPQIISKTPAESSPEPLEKPAVVDNAPQKTDEIQAVEAPKATEPTPAANASSSLLSRLNPFSWSSKADTRRAALSGSDRTPKESTAVEQPSEAPKASEPEKAQEVQKASATEPAPVAETSSMRLASYFFGKSSSKADPPTVAPAPSDEAAKEPSRDEQPVAGEVQPKEIAQSDTTNVAPPSAAEEAKPTTPPPANSVSETTPVGWTDYLYSFIPFRANTANAATPLTEAVASSIAEGVAPVVAPTTEVNTVGEATDTTGSASAPVNKV